MEDLQQVLDFQFCFAMDEFVQQAFGWTEGVSKLYYSLSQDYLYRDPYHHVTFIDNHDQDRFLSQVGGDINKLNISGGAAGQIDRRLRNRSHRPHRLPQHAQPAGHPISDAR